MKLTSIFIILCMNFLQCEGFWGGNLWVATLRTRRPSTTTIAQPGRDLKLANCRRPCIILEERGVASRDCPLSGFTSIPPRVYRLQGLQTLCLQENDITYVPPLHYKNLTMLDLSDNNINVIHDDAFKELTYLTILYLSNNRITKISKYHFRNLVSLRYLLLDLNRITRIEADVFFPALTSVERINLGLNRITEIHKDSFSQLMSLKFLHLEKNNITEITYRHLRRISKLEELILTQNNIQSLLPETFRDLLNLRSLDLSYNQIKHLPNRSFSLSYPNHSKLKRLSLSNNQIETIEREAFKGLHSLQTLHLAYNPLKEFPKGPFPPSLEVIQLHHMTELRILPAGAFSNLPNLKTVEVYSNPKLSVISAGSFSRQFRSLKLVDLRNNNLRSMPETVLDSWKMLESVDLSGNPWHCDCKIRWMKEVYLNTVVRQIIRCQTPSHLSGRPLNWVSNEEMACDIGTLKHWSVKELICFLLLVGTSVVFVSLLGLLLYMCRRQVFPCCYGQMSAYRALNSPKVDEDYVTLRRTINVSNAKRRALEVEAAATAPPPVAL